MRKWKLVAGAVLMLLAVRGNCNLAAAAGNNTAVNYDLGCTASGQLWQFDGSAMTCSAPKRPVTTIASLPACNTANKGLQYDVTNALSPVGLATVVAGGAVFVGVKCNGAAWIVQ